MLLHVRAGGGCCRAAGLAPETVAGSPPPLPGVLRQGPDLLVLHRVRARTHRGLLPGGEAPREAPDVLVGEAKQLVQGHAERCTHSRGVHACDLLLHRTHGLSEPGALGFSAAMEARLARAAGLGRPDFASQGNGLDVEHVVTSVDIEALHHGRHPAAPRLAEILHGCPVRKLPSGNGGGHAHSLRWRRGVHVQSVGPSSCVKA
mmetsp:Transcript_42112/g.131635  ORF Transcript_42112/g.131635 Transcript_42112/m.131635 type:complete len:204 (+) Transcript_42112:903-1514(+)